MKYFLHDSNARNDDKVTLLFIEFGYEGTGLFYSILEILAQQEKPVSEIVLKSQLKIGKKLEKHLKFMYKIGILSIKNGEVFNENILNFSEKYQIKKEKTRKKVSEWREKQKDTNDVTDYKKVRNQRKVKESKVKESKDNNTEIFNLLKQIFTERFYKLFEVEYYFEAKDGAKIKAIEKKIKNAYKSNDILDPTKDEMKVGFEHVLKLAERDKWLKENYSLSNIDSKFNEIISKKNGKASSTYDNLQAAFELNRLSQED